MKVKKRKVRRSKPVVRDDLEPATVLRNFLVAVATHMRTDGVHSAMGIVAEETREANDIAERVAAGEFLPGSRPRHRRNQAYRLKRASIVLNVAAARETEAAFIERFAKALVTLASGGVALRFTGNGEAAAMRDGVIDARPPVSAAQGFARLLGAALARVQR